ncbi:MAG: protein adenylyltransferase SelO family protein, partial [Pseudomonadota bacterium]|nr:protein adenylyltransferase SelO family protein [Pseudomonadota bacterium]
AAERANVAAKLGLSDCRDEDMDLIAALYALMEAAEVDMTIFFRALADADLASPAVCGFEPAFYDPAKAQSAAPDLSSWLSRYAARVNEENLGTEERRARMNRVNPRYALRNYLAQEAIDRAEQGDYQPIQELLEVMRRPYDEQPGRERYATRRPDWARDRAGCSMLSCSS